MTQRRSPGVAAAFLGLLVTLACGSDEGTGGGGSLAGGSSSGGSSSTGGRNTSGGSDDGEAGESSTAGSSAAGTSSGGSAAGGAPTAGTSTGGGGSGGASIGGAPGNPGEPCTGEGVFCVDENVSRACVEGVYEDAECGPLCTGYGFATGTCDAGCLCGEPVNDTCDLGTAAFCVCLEAETAIPCSAEEYFAYYALCHLEDPEFAHVACLADFVDETQMLVDCDAGAAACLAPPAAAQ